MTWNVAYNPNSVVLSVVAATGVSITKTTSLPTNTTHLGGGNFIYTVTVTNNNSSPATGVTVTDPLPAGVTFVSAVVSPASQGTCSGTTTVTCALGTLANGTSATVTITVTPAAIGSAVNTATVAFNGTGINSATATVQIQGTADLVLTKTAQPNPVNAGSPLSYTLTITNNGPSAATGVTLTDALPATTTLVSATPTQGTCTGTTTVNCALGTISGIGTAGTVSVVIVVTPTGSGPLANTANVIANEFDPNPANNTSTATVTVIPIADLALTKSASPNPASVGGNLTYTLTVTNSGPSPATGVTLTDALPTVVNFVSATPSQGICTPPVTCNLGTLPNGAVATVSIVVKATAVGTVLNTASVAANETDPNPANNTASVTTLVTASADVAVTETASLTNTHLGAGPFTYTLTVTNNGPSPATGVTLSDPLPGGVAFVSAKPTQGSCSGTVTISCALGPLANGASATVTIQVQPVTVGSAVNTATVTANEPDPVPSNNSSSVTVQILPSADLALTKTAQPTTTVNAGSPLTYTLNVLNLGPSPATGVKITDTLPAGATFVSASPACSVTTTIICTFASLPFDNSATATITVTPTGSGPLANGEQHFDGNGYRQSRRGSGDCRVGLSQSCCRREPDFHDDDHKQRALAGYQRDCEWVIHGGGQLCFVHAKSGNLPGNNQVQLLLGLDGQWIERHGDRHPYTHGRRPVGDHGHCHRHGARSCPDKQ